MYFLECVLIKITFKVYLGLGRSTVFVNFFTLNTEPLIL